MNKKYIPERNHIIWLDYEPTKSKEIGKYRPSLVLSSEIYSKNKGLVVCCPISTSIRGAKTEVRVNNLDLPSVVATSLIQTLSWKERKAQFITEADKGVMQEVLTRVMILIGADKMIEDFMA